MSNPEVVKLMSIVKEAVSRLDSSGEDINEVLADLSKEAELNKNEIKRVVEWTNTLKQLKLFKKAEDKTSEFDLADSNLVYKKIFGDPISESSEDLDKASHLTCKLPDDLSIIDSFSDENSFDLPEYDKSTNELTKKACLEISKLKSKEEEALLSINEVKDKFNNSLLKIAANLDKEGAEKFSDFEQSCLDQFGDECSDFILFLEKSAIYNNKRLSSYSRKNYIKETENTSLMKEALLNAKLYSLYKIAYNEAKNSREVWEEQLRKAHARRYI